MFFAAAILVTGSSALAQSTGSSLIAEGVDLRRDGHDAEALAVFERALAVDGSPRTRAQVALAEQALGLWVEAESDLIAAIAEGTGPWFERNAPSLRAAREAIGAHLATVDVKSPVPGAKLRVNGVPRGELPLSAPLRVAAGTVVVEVSAPGFVTETRSFQVAAAGAALETIDLVRDRSSMATVRTPDPLAADLKTRTQMAEQPPATGSREAAWVVLGGSLGFLVASGGAILVRNSNVAIYNDDSRCFYGGLTRDQRCGGYHDSATVAAALAIAGLGVAAIGGVSSAVMFGSKRQDRNREAMGLSCALGAGIACHGTF